MMGFVLKMMIFVFKMMIFVLKTTWTDDQTKTAAVEALQSR